MIRRFLRFVRALFFPPCTVQEINSAELIRALKMSPRPQALLRARTTRSLPANALPPLSSHRRARLRVIAA